MEDRYIIFGYDQYYPSGGTKDILCWAGARREVKTLVRQYIREYDYIETLDVKTKKIKRFSAYYLIDLEIWKKN